ncbi:MAG: Nramp family divalent metal transporter [Cypionkella sp.]
MAQSPFDLRSSNWRQPRGEAALSDVHASVALPKGTWRRFAAFLGPGYLVAVGYMDPGNWATSIAGGASFGYTLLVVALISNIMAVVLQSLCARLAIASGRDLAQACRDAFPKWVSIPLWALGRNRHHRHRYRRGDRHRHRPEPAVRHPAGIGRLDHRAGCVPDPVAANQGLSLA